MASGLEPSRPAPPLRERDRSGARWTSRSKYVLHLFSFVPPPESPALAKARTNFICQNCGAVAPRWQGKCEACNEWNSLVEEAPTAGIGALAARNARKGRVFALEGLAGESKPAPRMFSGMAELDRVTGGGFVPGSVLLIGGEPGIGKSTLLIQACAAMARKRRARGLYFRRGSGGAGAAARGTAWVERRAGRAGGGNLRRGHRRHSVGRPHALARGDQFDPDHVDGNGRIPRRVR